MILGASGVGHPRDGLGPGAEAADDREPGEGAQDGHPLGSHLRCHLYGAAQNNGPTASLLVSLK